MFVMKIHAHQSRSPALTTDINFVFILWASFSCLRRPLNVEVTWVSADAVIGSLGSASNNPQR